MQLIFNYINCVLLIDTNVCVGINFKSFKQWIELPTLMSSHKLSSFAKLIIEECKIFSPVIYTGICVVINVNPLKTNPIFGKFCVSIIIPNLSTLLGTT